MSRESKPGSPFAYILQIFGYKVDHCLGKILELRRLHVDLDVDAKVFGYQTCIIVGSIPKPNRHTETLGSSLSGEMLALPLPSVCFVGIVLLMGMWLISEIYFSFDFCNDMNSNG